MADVVVHSTQPALAAIKLAWWREQLEGLDEGKVPAEPRLQKVAADALSRGISGKQLARLADGWAGLLHDPIDHETIAERGVALVELLAALLRVPPPNREFGLIVGAVQAARLGFPVALPSLDTWADPRRSPPDARRITMFSALAARDARRGPPFEAEATPARALNLLRHRITGRL